MEERKEEIKRAKEKGPPSFSFGCFLLLQTSIQEKTKPGDELG